MKSCKLFIALLIVVSVMPFSMRFALAGGISGEAVPDQSSMVSIDAEQLAGRLAGIKAMRSDFEQEILDETGELLDEASGWFAWQQPDKFRWETLQPVEQSILIDGELYYQYDRDLDQMLVQALSEEVGVLPRLLLSGSAQKIQEKFGVSLIEKDKGVLEYRLLPVEQPALFTEVSLVFRAGELESMSITDELGQKNHFEFSSVGSIDKKNDIFELDPSPDTEVIYQ